MKFIKQHDERDCGAACLAMIAGHYGLKMPLHKFRDLTKTDRNGTNIYGLVDGASKIGLDADALSGSIQELIESIENQNVKFPFIAHIISEEGFEHFVIIENVYKAGFKVIDPASGRKKYSFQQFAQLYTGHIVVYSLTDVFKQGNYIKGGFVKFFAFLRGHYAKLVTIIILSLAVSFIGIAGSYVFKAVLDNFVYGSTEIACDDDCDEDHEHISSENEQESILLEILNFINYNSDKFNAIFILLIGLYLLQAGIQYSRGWLISKMSQKIDVSLITAYVDHIVDMPLEAVYTRKTGEYLSRFGDMDNIRDAISGATITLLMDSLMVIFCGFLLYNENSVLFFVSLIMILIYAVIVTAFRKPIKSINQDIMANNANVQSYLKETVSGIETIQSKNAQNAVKDKFNKKCDKFINKIFKGNLLYISQGTLTSLAEAIGTVVILWIGFGMALDNIVTAGSIITFYALLSYFIEPIKNLIGLQPMLQTAIVAAERLNDILDTPIENIQGEEMPENLNIEFKDVSFRYGNRDLVIENLSFSMRKGETIAIIGESGCGKTTIAKLLLGFYSCENGEITIGGRSISQISKSELRDKIAYVSQETFLFADTIKENIRLGNKDLTDEQIINACTVSAVDTFIKELPQEYNAVIDENANNLSGGQKQRLAIASALVNDPQIMILDEATSNLDMDTERKVVEAIKSRYSDTSMIFIAHRLNTVKNCDCIYVMDKGRIIEYGTHGELMFRKGKYYSLFSSSLS